MMLARTSIRKESLAQHRSPKLPDESREISPRIVPRRGLRLGYRLTFKSVIAEPARTVPKEKWVLYWYQKGDRVETGNVTPGRKRIDMAK